MYLSIVIPAYNEAQRLGNTLLVIHAYLQRQPYPAEIIVVDDGSQDATVSIPSTGAGQLGLIVRQHCCPITLPLPRRWNAPGHQAMRVRGPRVPNPRDGV
jgi:Glycosyl transferase family 2